jgi:lysophospholipase L1-like esterase
MNARYLALGDSYTIGEGVAASDRWPAVLVRLLRERGVSMDDPRYIARTGWTTQELSASIADEAPLGPLDLVTLLVGVNDQYRGRPVDDYRAAFSAVLETATGLAGGIPARVVVLSIPDWGVTPFALAEHRDPLRVAREIDAFNAANHAEAGARGAQWLDVTPSTREAAHDPGGSLVADGLHPSARLYAAWAERVLPLALVALRA